MQDDPNFWYTLVVDRLPALLGAEGVGNGQIIIYEGDYLAGRSLTPLDPIVAYSTELRDPAGAASYALCLYEA